MGWLVVHNANELADYSTTMVPCIPAPGLPWIVQ